MIEPVEPANEAARLDYLLRLKVLDTPLEARFERITRIVCQSLNVPISAVSMVDEDRQWFKSIQGLDVSETPRNVAFCAHAIHQDDMLVVPNTLEDSRFVQNPLVTSDPKIRFYAGAPLIMGDNIRIGTLCAIDKKPRQFEVDQLMVLRDLADMVQSELTNIVLSVSHQSLIDELKEAEIAAMVDGLTRLWNRVGGEKLLTREWESAKRNGAPLSVAMLDIDYFKQINDTYGHDIGDEVLKHVSQTLLSSLRPYDVAVRWGGEEFLIILPGCGERELYQVLDRVIEKFHCSPCPSEVGPIAVAVSIGGHTTNPKKEMNVNMSLKFADRALYEAKGRGRNRYVVEPMSNTEDETLSAAFG